MGIECENNAECLDGDHSDGDGKEILLPNCLLEKHLQGFPGKPAEIVKKLFHYMGNDG